VIRRILVPLDGSLLAESAIPHAAALARAFRSEVVLLRVVGGGPAADLGAVDSLGWRFQRAEAESYLQEVSSRFRAEGVPSTRVVEAGKASEQILEAARRRGVDLVVVSTHGEGGGTDYHLSGTASKVISSAECSVLVVPSAGGAPRGGGRAAYRRIVVPMDCSQRSDWAASLAASLAQATAAELVLVHVVPAPEVIGPRDSEAGRLAERLRAANRAAARAHLEGLKSRLGGPGLALRFRIDENTHVGQRVHQVAVEEGASLVVLAAHGCSPGTGWPYGNVAATLLAHGSTPVLVFQDLPLMEAGRTREPGAIRRPTPAGSM
jgi:nucleotide-binding universal stress UspA family protein